MGKTIIFIAEIAALALLGFICSELYLLKSAMPLGEEVQLSVSAWQSGGDNVIFREDIICSAEESITTCLETDAPSPSGESSQETSSPAVSEENAQQL